MVSKASDDLPEPETPETAVSFPCGISQSMPFKLWVRAPRITMASFTGDLSVVLFGGWGCTLQYSVGKAGRRACRIERGGVSKVWTSRNVRQELKSVLVIEPVS